MNNRLFLATLPLTLILLAGCSMTKSATPTSKEDPLLGGNPAVKPASYNQQTNTAPISGVPPVPAPYSTTSTAALANGASHQSLDSSRDLQIEGNQNHPQAAGDGWRGQGTSNGSGIVLNQPEPIQEQELRPMAPSQTQPNFTTTGGSTASSVDSLLGQLKARGMIWGRLDLSIENSEYKFICAFPSKQNPDVRRTYEARAGDPDSALRGVLDRIESDR